MTYGSIRPIIVTVDKSEITGAIADGAYSSVQSIDIPAAYEGGPSMYWVRQILVKSEDEPTNGWNIVFHRNTGGTNADLDTDTVECVENVTDNSVDSPQSGVGYYSNSDLYLLITATATGTAGNPSPPNQIPMQMHFQLGPNGGSKTSGATGEVVVKFWLEPVLGY